MVVDGLVDGAGAGFDLLMPVDGDAECRQLGCVVGCCPLLGGAEVAILGVGAVGARFDVLDDAADSVLDFARREAGQVVGVTVLAGGGHSFLFLRGCRHDATAIRGFIQRPSSASEPDQQAALSASDGLSPELVTQPGVTRNTLSHGAGRACEDGRDPPGRVCRGSMVGTSGRRGTACPSPGGSTVLLTECVAVHLFSFS